MILNNQEYDQDLSGKTINIKFNAKSNSNNNESISIKIRLKLGSSGNNYIVSDELTLSSENITFMNLNSISTRHMMLINYKYYVEMLLGNISLIILKQ